MLERLQKVLAGAGIGSRRACEEWIKQGRVRVGGQVVTELGVKVDLETERVTFDGRPVRPPARRYYIALNKPRGVVCTRQDPHAGRLVTDLVDLSSKPLLRPVGRLDADSEGLLFLTDDGDFLYRLTHPKHHVPKTYRASVRGVPDAQALARLTQGVVLDDGPTLPADQVHVRHAVRGAEISQAEVELTIYEGRNRQVRRMLAAVGHPVTRLIRLGIGAVRLGSLPSGAWRHLTVREVRALTGADATQENKNSCPTVPPPSTPPKEPSLSGSRRPRRPGQRPTSSHSPRKGSTTA